ncbi:regulator of (H+)-ATPase in vacuolar membrane [Boothiomyces macroporosus]|uniref:Regulator of (H+)-ATPase in vacuolar membrane n=1 Tax=Boothiomyces macroporosus TaxID=261099 RepID=A0AAD5UL31_9FUNG|nr:regulator of (H+)-ATPase in vacuolar membrane [Boothiomyces macroporosus]
MNKEGLFGAKPNFSDDYYPTISSSTFQGTTICYATGSIVNVLTGDFKLLQQIQASGRVNCVAIHPITKTICFTVGDLITKYSFHEEKWNKLDQIQTGFEINSIDWAENGNLLVVGSKLVIYKPDYSLELSAELPFSPSKCQYSPCCKFIALFSKWRFPSDSRLCNNALMTRCNDQIVRFWAQNEHGYGFYNFDLCGVVDPTTTNQSSVLSNQYSISCLHWLTGKALADALRTQKEIKSFRKTLISSPSKLTDSLAEFPDMLFEVRSNGTMGLASIPSRVTKINTIMVSERTVQESDFAFFGNPIHSFYSIPVESCNHTPEITFLTRNDENVMNAYSMNLDDFFNHNWSSPRLYLRVSWSAPQSEIQKIVKHQALPLFALFDHQNQLLIYSSRLPRIGLRSTLGLTFHCQVPFENTPDCLNWFPNIGNAIKLIFIENIEYRVEEVCSKRTEKFMLLDIQQNDDSVYRLLAVSSLGNVKFFNVDDERIEVNMESESQIPNVLHAFSIRMFDFKNESIKLCRPSQFGVITDTYKINLYDFEDSPTLSDSSNKQLTEVYSIDSTTKNTIVDLSIAAFGKVAIGIFYSKPAHESNGQYLIDILDNEIDGLDLIFEYQIQLKYDFTKERNKFVDMAWHSCYDGQHLLAVADTHTVNVYTNSHVDAGIEWKSIIDFVVEEHENIQAVSWLQHGALFVATNLKTFIFSPWKKDGKGVPANMLELSSVHSGRLEDYNPSLLIQYMFWGKYDLVKYNLSLLHRFVKLSIEANRKLTHLPIPLWKLTGEDNDISNKMAYEDLFGVTDETALSELGTFSKTHVDYLVENLPISGIENFDDVTAFVKAFEQIEQHRRSLDENGLRYYIAAIYQYHRQTPHNLSPRDYCWGFFSDSQDYILDVMTQCIGGKLKWKDARDFGMGYWIANYNTLKTVFENIARNQFWGENGVNDPVACSLYYLALKKKNVLTGLWKLANSHPEQNQMMKFLANNFDEDRWKTAAQKNAFALLGKQRYEYAAAFFLLAGKLKDAANVCIKQLKDPQLAITICRIYEGEGGPVLSDILQNQLIPDACKADDRWLSCLLWTIANNRENAFYSLTRPLPSLLTEPCEVENRFVTVDPALLLLYNRLQTVYKTLILPKIPRLTSLEEIELYVNCARSYDKLGCPSLALEMIIKHKLDTIPEIQLEKEGDILVEETAGDNEVLGTTEIGWGAPDVKKESNGLDWGEIESKPTSTGLDWGELESKPTSGGIDWGELDTKPSGGLDFSDYESGLKDLDDLPNEELDIKPLAKPSEVPIEIPVVSKKEYLRLHCRKNALEIFKRFLVMRILHDLHNSTETVSYYKKELQTDPTLSKYTEYLKKGFQDISNTSKLDIDEISHMLRNRFGEIYELEAWVGLLPFADSMDDHIRFTNEMFTNQANFICSLCFEGNFKDYSMERYAHIEFMSRQLLIAATNWYSKCLELNCTWSESAMAQAVGAGYMIQILLATVFHNKNRLWWMIGLCDQLFDGLLKNDAKAIMHVVNDALADHNPIAHPDDVLPTDDHSIELYDEYGIALYTKESTETITAQKLIYSMVLTHATTAFKLYLERLAEIMNVNSNLDETFGFLTQGIEKGLVAYIYELDLEVTKNWLRLDMNFKNITAYIMELQIQELWSLLNRTGNVKKTANAIFHTKSIKKWDSGAYIDEDLNAPEFLSETIVNSENIINSFAINPLDHHQIVYATPTSICEIDTRISENYFSNDDPKVLRSQEDLPKLNITKAVPVQVVTNFESEELPMKKDLSFDSINRLIKRSFKPKPTNNFVDKGLRLRRAIYQATTLESHKSLNYCSPEVAVKLYQFGQAPELLTYTAQSEGRLTNCHFDPYGAKFGASDSRGDLYIWKFDAEPSAVKPCISLKQCHQGAINDFAFLNSSSVVATAGTSTNGMNVSIWDTLLPHTKARVKAFPVGEAGITSLVFFSQDNLLIAGGKKGSIYAIDIRSGGMLLNDFVAFDSSVKSLAFHEEKRSIVAGSSKGEIKVHPV